MTFSVLNPPPKGLAVPSMLFAASNVKEMLKDLLSSRQGWGTPLRPWSPFWGDLVTSWGSARAPCFGRGFPARVQAQPRAAAAAGGVGGRGAARRSVAGRAGGERLPRSAWSRSWGWGLTPVVHTELLVGKLEENVARGSSWDTPGLWDAFLFALKEKKDEVSRRCCPINKPSLSSAGSKT